MYKYLSFPDEEIVSGMLYSTDLNQCDNRKSKWKIPKKQTRGLEMQDGGKSLANEASSQCFPHFRKSAEVNCV